MAAKCPHCGKPVAPIAENKAFPFCSPRCRTIDLGAWLTEDYRIAVPPEESERDGMNEDQLHGGPAGRDDEPPS